jgi:hypothetical protein
VSNYIKATDFAVKDGLLTGNPNKIIKGTEIDDEFNAIAVAVQTKADLASPTFTGTPAAPTAAGGTNTTQIATTAFANAAVTAERTATATLTNKTIDLSNNNVSGTIAQFNTALSDGNFATIAGAETLTNKTLTSPILTTPAVNVINEETSGSGVTIDGVLIKDSAISGQYTPLFRDTEKATTSGSNIDFTGIPSWVKRITVVFSEVSHNAAGGTSNMIVQLGDAGGIETTGYVAASMTDAGDSASTAGFVMRSTNESTSNVSGIMTFVNISGNTWVSSHALTRNTTAAVAGGGTKTLSDTLTQIRLTTISGTPAFDAGSINILYE